MKKNVASSSGSTPVQNPATNHNNISYPIFVIIKDAHKQKDVNAINWPD